MQKDAHCPCLLQAILPIYRTTLLSTGHSIYCLRLSKTRREIRLKSICPTIWVMVWETQRQGRWESKCSVVDLGHTRVCTGKKQIPNSQQGHHFIVWLIAFLKAHYINKKALVSLSKEMYSTYLSPCALKKTKQQLSIRLYLQQLLHKRSCHKFCKPIKPWQTCALYIQNKSDKSKTSRKRHSRRRRSQHVSPLLAEKETQRQSKKTDLVRALSFSFFNH